MTTWILLRGLTREARHWGGFPLTLAQWLPAAQVLTVDLPGNGEQYAQRCAARVERITESLRAGLAARGVAPPYRLLALSLGAMVAVDWATRHADEVAGAVLINTSLRGLNPAHHRLRPASIPRLLRIAATFGDAARERAILALTSHTRYSEAEERELVERWSAWRRERPVSAANALRQFVAAMRFRAPQRPPVPLLLLASRADALCDVRCSRRIAERWDVPLREHPEAGHDLPLDDAPWLAKMIAGWVEASGDAPVQCVNRAMASGKHWKLRV